MSTSELDVDAALLAAAQALPSHFTGGDDLTIETLDAIQATTMSLPGGAFAVESVLKEAGGNVGPVVLIVTGLIDHANGEVFSRDEARTLWTAALTEALEGLKEGLGDFTAGQIHMTDAFDVLDNSDEANVVGIFSGQTLAGMLLAQPAVATGEGAAALLAAEVAAATAEEEDEVEGAEDEGAEDADGAEAGDGAEGAEASESSESELGAAGTGLDGGAGQAGAPGMMPGMGMPGMAGMPGMMPPGMMPGGYVPSAAQQAAMAAEAQAYAAQQALLQGAASTQQFQPLAGGMAYPVDPRRMDLLRDVIMGVSVELGRTRLTVQEILGLTPGSIVELDRAAGAPVDVLVNGTLIAHGEVVVVDEEFAVRISDVVSPDSEGRVTA